MKHSLSRSYQAAEEADNSAVWKSFRPLRDVTVSTVSHLFSEEPYSN